MEIHINNKPKDRIEGKNNAYNQFDGLGMIGVIRYSNACNPRQKKDETDKNE